MTEVIDFLVLHADHATSILKTQITLSQNFHNESNLLFLSKRFCHENAPFSIAWLLLGLRYQLETETMGNEIFRLVQSTGLKTPKRSFKPKFSTRKILNFQHIGKSYLTVNLDL